VYNLLGNIYDDDNQTDKALGYYQKGIQLDPEYQRLHFNLGITNYRIGKYAEAESNAMQAIKLEANHASSLRLYAMATNKLNKPGRAILGWCSFLQSSQTLPAVPPG
jgi:tetratricopeptide (TPR) repeat protein